MESRLGHTLPADFEDRYHQELFAAMRADLTAVPGVENVLDTLAESAIPTCVASSGSHARIELALKTTGLHERFMGRLFSADDVERSKPFPDLFLYAAKQMGVAPPAAW